MQHQEFEPPHSLRDAIKCFWYEQINVGARHSGFDVMPDSYAEIIFYFGSVCSISTDAGLQSLPSPFLVGLLGKPVRFHTEGHLEIIGVRCFPWAVFDLLGLPSGSDGVRVLEHPVAPFQSSLEEYIKAGRIAEAVAQIRQYFLQAPPGIGTNRMLCSAGVALREANGTLPVRHVAAAAHASVRTLERKFKQSSGYTVKEVSGLMRFEQARNRLWLYPNSNLSDLAYALGYADQSHLIREFKRYSGTTPAAFARKTGKQNKP